MHNLVLITIGLMLISCSTQDKKVQDLELKVKELSKALNLDKNKEYPIESPTMNLKIPSTQNYTNKGVLKKISLGEVDYIDFSLFLDQNSYTLVLISKNNQPQELIGQAIINVTHKDRSPESFNLFNEKSGVFKTYGDNISGNVELEIIFLRDNRKSIIFKIEAVI